MKYLLPIFLFFVSITGYSQTLDELKEVQKLKKDSISDIQKRVDALQSKIDKYPGWRYGAFGTIGISLSEFDKWYSQGTPNVSSGKIGGTVNLYANLNQEKYFWRNSALINLSWLKYDDKDDPNDDDSYREATDVFNISSLYGYKLSSKFAASALMEYRTTILSNFNDPGYLDLGIGATWTPLNDLVVVFHPLNYNLVFSDEDNIYTSSAGCKILADYNRKFGALSIKSNLSVFMSYKDSNYSNWTWTNAFGYTLWKNIGVGFEFALRDNQQEALDYALNTIGNADATFDNIDNDIQSYWIFGLNYNF
ncbi:DUF3078 domain-containing protein [Robertkochia solimangrovi]|uniref:DUF3078 domain-containing protein n=1 Tax=Robertkochia solimangrovi TaxID=2213046 RepID=UPI00118142ED|nr:DUF3078 domain-containing protein [Robertkochia solimangrovi]TRZ46450.1 hypothetical protein DMZ48_01445 [Robertkochia solimangrovi]